MSPQRLLLVALGMWTAGCAAGPVDGVVAATPTQGVRAPLSWNGAPIGDVVNDFDVYVPQDKSFARLTAKRGVQIHLDKQSSWSVPSSEHTARTGPRPRVDLGGEIGPVRFDLCFDHAAIPFALRERGQAVPQAPTVVNVGDKPFAIERTDLCFEDGDVAAPFLLFVASWTAPDGTRITVEGGAKDMPKHLRLRSQPQRTEAEILALLL